MSSRPERGGFSLSGVFREAAMAWFPGQCLAQSQKCRISWNAPSPDTEQHLDFLPLLQSLGWPDEATSGTLSWSNGDKERNHMDASITLSPNGELVMSSQATWNERSHQRFSAIVPAGKDVARVSMPGYERSDVSIEQAIGFFRAHTTGLETRPVFNAHRTRMAP
jgi:hypothetical protein